MHIEAQAILCAARPHGENGAIVSAFTAETGMLAGYVRGGHSRRLRPVLLPGNLIRGEWRARTDEQLPALTVELVESRSTLFGEPLAAAALDWATALTTATLPEGASYPRLHAALDAVLAAMALAPAARNWAGSLVRYELLLLSELGFGLDLSGCAMGGTGRLAFVSPKSGAAVSESVGQPYAGRLLRLPPFLLDGGAGDWTDHLDGLRLTGLFLERDLLQGRAAMVLAARERLVDRLKRIG